MTEQETSKILVILERTDAGYSAYLPELPGCISTAESLDNIKKMIRDSVDFHLEGLEMDKLEIPEAFRGGYNLVYKMDVSSLFEWFSGILTKSGVSRITGLNQSLVSQYVSGYKKPGTRQIKKIERALHQLGQELLEIRL